MTEELTRHWVRVPTALAEQARKSRELEWDRKARYEIAHNRKAGKKQRISDRADRPFIIWDGEQPQDTGYSLFGNSEGKEICHPSLGTEECLKLIIETEIACPEAIHCGFGFNFDVSWILKDIGWTRLNRLKKTGSTFWRGYRIQHVPRKWFTVSYGPVSAKIFEVFSFFNRKLTDALEDWEIGPWATTEQKQSSTTAFLATQNSVSPFPLNGPQSTSPLQNQRSVVPSLDSVLTMSEKQLVETFKSVRSGFTWNDIEAIRIYMRLELKYTRLLMERLRETFLAAGYLPKSWHGPGALAREAFQRHNVYAAKAVCPAEVRHASRCAFIGGRFTPRIVGHMKRRVYSVDRNSAYPYAMTFLPNLAKGTWRFATNPHEIREAIEQNKFALFRIQYYYRGMVESADDWEDRINHIRYGMFPLPRRRKDGGVGWAHRVTSWYWTPEARLVKDSPHAEYIGAWIFDEDDPTDRPFAWVAEYYHNRQLLKRLGNPAEYTFKIIINADFGQCAQRVGWDKKNRLPPKSHQLEWAGYTTSHCRAAMYEMVERVGEENVISIDTDGLYTLRPIPFRDGELGDDLGQWKCEEYDDMIVWQSGMYGLKTNDCRNKKCGNFGGSAIRCGHEWSKAKTRGIPKGAYSPEDLIKALENGQHEVSVQQNKFIGYGMALNGSFKRLNTWTQEPATFKLGGASALTHVRDDDCKRVCRDGIHRLQNNPFFWNAENPESEPHYLPWLDNNTEITTIKELGDDITFFDDWNPDVEEEWRLPDEELAMVV